VPVVFHFLPGTKVGTNGMRIVEWFGRL